MSIVLVNLVLAMGCIVFIVLGAQRSNDNLGIAFLIIGLVGLIVIGAVFPLTLVMYRATGGVGQAGGFGRGLGGTTMPQALQGLENLLSHIHDNTMLSDNAKRVLFRDRELDLFRRAIEEDIAHGDYSSGLTLCDEMANLFGHREEAEAFRTRILQAGHASYEAVVQDALRHFEHVLSTRDWAQAHSEAARLRRLYPNHHLVQEIDLRILQVRDEHKRELEAQFLQAAERSEVDAAMLLLKQLDRYLTREEAARLAQTAQGVVVKHRDKISMQFKMAVNDHRWAQAADLGDLIVREYPNTKMADEVRAILDVLRQRATQSAVASPT